MARCMLLDADLPTKYWAEAVNTANYLQNRLPTRSMEVTPYEAWWGEKPDVSHLHAFGTDAYVWIPKQNRTKFDAAAQKMTFVGYSSQQKAYRFLDRSTGLIINSRDARFLPESSIQETEEDDGSIMEYHFPSTDEVHSNSFPIVAGDVLGEPADDEEEGFASDTESEDPFDTATEPEDDITLTEDHDTDERPLNAPSGPSATSTPMQPLRVSSRVNKGVPPPRFPEATRLVGQEAFEPRTVAEALASPERDHWKNAMDEEYAALQENSTWDIVNLPENRKPVGCRWIFKKKLDEQGNVARYKARLVAQGFSQKFGTDYDEVYAPVAKHTTLRALLSVAARRKMQVKHVDIKTAYLYGEISETIYMRQPPGYETGNPGDVCHLRRSLYGLKQAGRVWNQTITDVLKQLGYEPTEADSCLFVKQTDGGLSFILLYVDDMLIVTNSKKEYERVLKHLEKRFKISCLGDVKNYLGIHVERQEDGSFLLSQENYIERMLTKFGMEQAKPSPIPMDPGYVTAEKKEENVMASSEKYQSLVGALLYVAVCTRPDLAITASILGRKVSKPTESDWTEAKRALRYLKGTAGLKLQLGGSGNLEGYADADWAGDRVDRKSNSGFLFKLGGGTISWTARKQDCVTLSSTEAEYVSLAEASKELLWLLKLMRGLGENIQQPVIIHEDNQSCISMLSAEGETRRTKHIDTRYNFVRDLTRTEAVKVKYCPTEDMLADMLTKPLSRIKLQKMREEIGLQNIVLEEEC